MSETVRLGGVDCDFMAAAEFRQLAEGWLLGGGFHHVVTLNPEMIMAAQRQETFRAAAAAATVRVPDGAGLVWARWYLRSPVWPLLPSLLAFLFQRVERVTGVEAVMTLGELAATHRRKLYLLGGTLAERQKTAEKLRQQWPQLQVILSPAHTYALEGPPDIVADIQQHAPDILLVAYGAPKQTEWIEHHRQHFPSVRIAVGVGGAFAILSEDLPRAPLRLQRLNLEWLWRLYLEPSRLARIWRATVQFPLLIRRQKLQQQNSALPS